MKRLVGSALDRGAREREAASVLLSALSGAAVPVAALERGFWDLAAATDDLELDVPGKRRELRGKRGENENLFTRPRP